MKNKQYSRNKHTTRKKHIFVATAMLLLICLIGGLWLANVITIFHKSKVVPVSGPLTKGEASQGNPTGNAQSNNGSIGNTTKSTTNSQTNNGTSTATTGNLLAPTGDFVSDHHPNLSGSPAPNTMSSVCTTTPEATCIITFTNNGVAKHLASETTDSNGSAYWYWKLQDIGLTAGSWQIQAIATLNGQTKTASDAMELVVSQ
ncbi:MAG TPA: hypothetical protein VMR18_04090 [Candidatus Saccharimonadales bacterium]|jgi:hypothetical protein|nr:hypothetical protein [Candidatus Saccharimonadales bacterium]